jgi:hypothetical protein
VEVIKKILANPNKYSSPVRVFVPQDFGKYVLTWLGPPEKYMVGRLVQVRLEAGAFGSDLVLLRHFDDVLMRHENQNFHYIPDLFKDDLDKLFESVCQDSVDIEYTIGEGISPKTGFIIPSEVPDGDSTPMRDVIAACKNEIAKLIEKELA